MNNFNSSFKSKDIFQIDNLPNRLTIFRILLIPIVLSLIYISGGKVNAEFLTPEIKSTLGWVAAGIFGIASITDFFDGYIARKRSIVTVFGTFLDPIADKFLTVSSLIMLQSLGRIPSFLVIILVLREMYMTSLRLLAMNQGVQVPVSQMGKWKTAIQMLGIPLLIAYEPWNEIPLDLVGTYTIYLAGVLSIWSAIAYTYGMIGKLKLQRHRKRLLKKRAKFNEKRNDIS